MDTLEKAELTASIIGRFLKSGILIFSSEVPDTAGSKTRRKEKKNTGNCKLLCVSCKHIYQSYKVQLSFQYYSYKISMH